MTRVNDINQYKKAKIIVKDLTKVLTTINASLAGLYPHKKYKPVLNAIYHLEDSKSVLEYNLEHYKMVLETKGEVPPSTL